jgi:hypothetical protein
MDSDAGPEAGGFRSGAEPARLNLAVTERAGGSGSAWAAAAAACHRDGHRNGHGD